MVGRHWKIEEFLELTWVLMLQVFFVVVFIISDHPDIDHAWELLSLWALLGYWGFSALHVGKPKLQTTVCSSSCSLSWLSSHHGVPRRVDAVGRWRGASKMSPTVDRELIHRVDWVGLVIVSSETEPLPTTPVIRT